MRVETALFVIGFLVSLVLLALTTFRVVTWPVDLGGHSQMSWAVTMGRYFLAAVAIFSGCRGIGLVACSFLGRRQHRLARRRRSLETTYVSILVPCFNEGTTIQPALESLLELDYPRYEILVVNDGSTDDTLAKAHAYAGQHGGVSVRVFDKPNGGKWIALNFAFQRAAGELILCVDADSRLAADSLRRMAARMEDPRVAVVAGQVRVRNRHNLITQLQSLEYQMGNGAVRMGQGFFGTVLVVAGPLGLFRRSVMEEVFLRYGHQLVSGRPGHAAGPYEHNTFAEDFDLSLTILSLGGRIVYEPDAISFTKAPDRAFTLMNQRYRWLRGSFQVLRKFVRRSRGANSEMRSWRLLAWLSLTYLPDLTLIPVAYVVGLAYLVTLAAVSGAAAPILALGAAILIMQSCMAAFFLSIHRDSLSLLKFLPLLDIYCGILLGSVWVISVADELRGSRMRW
jgi:poly-beta-1,6-N-acetyl-D-glucosamine synthase